MWFLNLLLRFNENSHCTQPQLPKSSFHIFCSITSSNHTKKITSQEKLIFQCNLAMCFLKDSRVALTFEQIEQTKPPVCTCFDSMCVFTCETFLDAKLHCKQNHCPVSSFCRLATIRSSSSEEKQMYQLACASASCAFSKLLSWDICMSRPNIENHQS